MCRPGRRSMVRHNHLHPPSAPSLREPSFQHFQHPSTNALAASVSAANRSHHGLLPRRLARYFRAPPAAPFLSTPTCRALTLTLASQASPTSRPVLRRCLTSVIGPLPLTVQGDHLHEILRPATTPPRNSLAAPIPTAQATHRRRDQPDRCGARTRVYGSCLDFQGRHN
jgi:hypothetical protein